MSAKSSPARRPVDQATANIVLYGSGEASMMRPACSSVKNGRSIWVAASPSCRSANETFATLIPHFEA
jgi:hypothetical protein